MQHKVWTLEEPFLFYFWVIRAFQVVCRGMLSGCLPDIPPFGSVTHRLRFLCSPHISFRPFWFLSQSRSTVTLIFLSVAFLVPGTYKCDNTLITPLLSFSSHFTILIQVCNICHSSANQSHFHGPSSHDRGGAQVSTLYVQAVPMSKNRWDAASRPQ